MGGSIQSSGCSALALPATYPTVAAGAPPVTGGGGLAGTSVPLGATQPPGGDIETAIANLRGALDQLSAALGAMGGAAQVTAGGAGAPTGGSGCGCAGTAPGSVQATPVQSMQGPVQVPVQVPPTPAQATSPGDEPPAGGSVRDRIVAAAEAELAKGVREDAGPDNDSDGNIKRYRSAVTGPGEDPNLAEPWCADFASYVWKQAGVPFGKDGRGEDYTVAMIDWAKSQGRYHPRGSTEPKPGDLVMIDWGGGQDVDHVAVVAKVENGRVHTIGGNESDGIKAASYPLDDARMMGFITPAGG